MCCVASAKGVLRPATGAGGPSRDVNAQRSDAGWVRREINCTAGWSSVGRSWRWHCRSLAIRRSTDETPWPAARPPPCTKMRSRAIFQCVPQGRQRDAQRRGLGSARDKLHGRVVMRRSVVEMARTVGSNTVVDGRATGPDPRRKQACARSSGTAREVARERFVAASAPDPRRQVESRYGLVKSARRSLASPLATSIL